MGSGMIEMMNELRQLGVDLYSLTSFHESGRKLLVHGRSSEQEMGGRENIKSWLWTGLPL